MGRHPKYFSYVVRHKWFVLVAGMRTGAPLWRLLIHDWSKFLPSEWMAYARFFYTDVQAGETVRGVADNAPFEGKVLDTRPCDGFSGGGLDCLVDQGPRPWWAWAPEVVRRIEVEDAFDRAWLLHQHRNPHHWQHWLLRMDDGRTVALEMPDNFVREMVADWMGAGRAITGKWEMPTWYAANRDKIVLHSATRVLVDALVAKQGGTDGA